MKITQLYLVFLLGILFSIAPQAEENNLLKTIENESNVLEIFNAISTIDWTPENLSMLEALWKKDFKTYPNLPREKLNNDTVRLALANILMQANRHHCPIKIDMDELHDFVKSKAMSSDLEIKGDATFLLGLAGYDEDIPFLSAIVKEEQEGYAESAVSSLTSIHSYAAIDELRKLNKQVKRPSLKKDLQEVVEGYKNKGITNRTKGCYK